MSSKIVIGCLTIGQTPRQDILNDLAVLLPKNYKLAEFGALDGLSKEELTKLASSGQEEYYITLLKDGTAVKVSKEAMEKLIEKKLAQLEKGDINLAVLLCTGEFPPIDTKIPYFRSSEIVKEKVKSKYRQKKIGIIVPSAGQKNYLSKRWKDLGIEHDIYACPPYSGSRECTPIIKKLKESKADFILLDCLGYDLAMARKISQETDKPVLLPRQVIAEHLIKYIDDSPLY